MTAGISMPPTQAAAGNGDPIRRSLVRLEDVGIQYRLIAPAPGIKQLVRRSWRLRPERFWALREVSLSIEPGQIVGVMGHNGSGKSSLCRLLGGIADPGEGRIESSGRVSAVMSLGGGMKADLTGRQNVELMSVFLGVPRRDLPELIEQVRDFAQIGRFFDQPIRSYSAGMKARLGFGVATAINPDVLVLDEVIRVGDEAFRVRCESRIRDMVARSGAVVVVSHAMNLLREFCTHGLWLDQGRVRGFGEIGEIAEAYLKASSDASAVAGNQTRDTGAEGRDAHKGKGPNRV